MKSLVETGESVPGGGGLLNYQSLFSLLHSAHSCPMQDPPGGGEGPRRDKRSVGRKAYEDLWDILADLLNPCLLACNLR